MIHSVYILHHYYELSKCEEVKLIGAFSSEEEAQRIIEKYKKLPGFKYYPNDFYISEYKIDVPAWREGFLTWAKGEKPLAGENGNDFAKRLLDEKYGKGNWNKGPRSEHNKLRKYGDRSQKK